ncbi:hypothetical protein, partial [Comamonas aquatica]|uniref:hypothetical protein n=1 Tax=Comamonas aquatica TaxID=225991 RepID=UPI001EF182B7
LLARPLQQGLDDLELLAARVAGVLLGSHPSIVREQLKILNRFLEVALLRSATELPSAAHTSASLWCARDEFAF